MRSSASPALVASRRSRSPLHGVVRVSLRSAEAGQLLDLRRKSVVNARRATPRALGQRALPAGEETGPATSR